MKTTERIIEFDSMLHVSVQRVGRAVRNMHQEMGGFPSMSSGNSSGGGSGATIDVDIPTGEAARLPQDPDVAVAWADCQRPVATVDHVPVTSVEAQALFSRDEAHDALVRLDEVANQAAVQASIVLKILDRPEPPGRHGQMVGAVRLVVLTYARVRRIVDPLPAPAAADQAREAMRLLDRYVSAIFSISQQWGYDTRRQAVPKARADLLAVDLTEALCTSHLRVGDRRDRDRGELCQWCRKFKAVEGFVPPRELVRIHVDQGRVYDHQVAPFRQSHRDRAKGRPVRS